jgi:hypothetical protein
MTPQSPSICGQPGRSEPSRERTLTFNLQQGMAF